MKRLLLIFAPVLFSFSAYSFEIVPCESLDLKSDAKEVFTLVKQIQQTDKFEECRTHNIQCVNFSGVYADLLFTIEQSEKRENYRISFKINTGELLKSDLLEKKKGLFGSEIYTLYSKGPKFSTTVTKITRRKNNIESVKVSNRDLSVLALLDWQLMFFELFKAPNYSFKCK